MSLWTSTRTWVRCGRAVNALSAAGRERPLAATGAGYGLTGLRERAELAGGTMTARELDDAWRVCVTVPG